MTGVATRPSHGELHLLPLHANLGHLDGILESESMRRSLEQGVVTSTPVAPRASLLDGWFVRSAGWGSVLPSLG